MRQQKYHESICFRVSRETRAVIDRIANENQQSLGDVARMLLDAGIEALGS